MPTSLTFDEHVAALRRAGDRLVELAVEAGMGTPVPTCPAWNVDALLAHQAMVHRWAGAHVRGDDPDALPNQTEIRRTAPDLPSFYIAGLDRLVTSLTDAPDDLAAMTFLNDSPAPRAFWARRQAHETTIHMADALAATLGRPPTAADADIDAAVAADGVDELLRGFFTRGRTKLADGDPYVVDVVATDVGRRWVLHVAERLTVADDTDGATWDGDSDATITGPAADLYLALWNRGGTAEAAGRRADVLERWAASQKVRWS